MNTLQLKLNKNGIDYKASDFKPEIHFIGQIVGASNVQDSDGIFCDIYFEVGVDWKILSPNQTYQTQTAYPSYGNSCIFAHPFDIHYTTKSIFGWPRLICRVWKFDDTNKIDILSYGVTTLPNTSGYHELDFNTWTLQGNLKNEIIGFFMNSKPKMNTVDPLSLNLNERKELLSKPGPTVHITCEVLLKNFYFHSITGQT